MSQVKEVKAIINDKGILNEIKKNNKIDIYFLKEPFGRYVDGNVVSSDIFIIKDESEVFYISVEEHDCEEPIYELYSLKASDEAPTINIINTNNIKLGGEGDTLSFPHEKLEYFGTLLFNSEEGSLELYSEIGSIKDENGSIIYITEEENILLLKNKNKIVYISCSEFTHELTISKNIDYINEKIINKKLVYNLSV